MVQLFDMSGKQVLVQTNVTANEKQEIEAHYVRELERMKKEA